MCKKIIGATSTEGKEAAQIQLCAKKYQEDWIYTTLKNLENPSNSIPPSIKNSCCVDIALVPKLNGAQLCYFRSTEPKTESNIIQFFVQRLRLWPSWAVRKWSSNEGPRQGTRRRASLQVIRYKPHRRTSHKHTSHGCAVHPSRRILCHVRLR